ncbi:MAG: hypothetical protein CL878_01695 [Dehalococcoidia bacterium]|nr:hypothetical protein [Dehalococcoidia bacterium]
MSATLAPAYPRTDAPAWELPERPLETLGQFPTLVVDFCDRTIETGLALALASVPLYVNLAVSSPFELGKATLTWAVVVLTAFVLRTLIVQVAQARGDLPVSQSRGQAFLSWLQEAGWSECMLVVALALYLLALVVVSSLSIAPAVSWLGQTDQFGGTLLILGLAALAIIVASRFRQVPAVQVNRLLDTMLLASVPVFVTALVSQMDTMPLEFLDWPVTFALPISNPLGHTSMLTAYLLFVGPVAVARLFETIGASRRRPFSRDTAVPLGRSRTWGGLVSGLTLIVLTSGLFVGFLYGIQEEATRWWAALPVVGTVVLLCGWTARGTPGSGTRLLGLVMLLILATATTIWIGGAVPAAILAGLLLAMGLVVSIRNRRRWLAVMWLSALLLGGGALVTINVPSVPTDPWLEWVPWLQPLMPVRSILTAENGLEQFDSWLIGLAAWRAGPTHLPWLSDPVSDWRQLTGWGPQTYDIAYGQVAIPAAYADVGWTLTTADSQPPHAILAYLVGGGAAGIGAYIALVLAVYVRGIAVLRETARPVMVAALLAALTGYLVEAHTGAVSVTGSLYAWTMAGLLAVLGSTQRELAGNLPSTLIPLAPPPESSSRWLGPSLTVGAVAAGIGAAYLASHDYDPGLLPHRAAVWGAFWAILGLAALSIGDVWPHRDDPTPPNFSQWWIAPVGLLLVAGAFAALIQLWRPVAAATYARLATSTSLAWSARAELVGEALTLAPYDDEYARLLAETLFEPLAELRLGEQELDRKALDPLSVVSLEQWDAATHTELRAAAEEAISHALIWHPRRYETHLLQGKLLELLSESDPILAPTTLDAVREPYERARVLRPGLIEPQLALAQAMIVAGAELEAEELLAEARQDAPDAAPVYVALGDLWWQQGRSQDAWEAHVHALELDPSSWDNKQLTERVAAYLAAGWESDLLMTLNSIGERQSSPASARLIAYVQAAANGDADPQEFGLGLAAQHE